MLERFRRLFIYDGFYYPFMSIGLYTTSTKNYHTELVWSKKLFGYRGLWFYFPEFGIKCKIKDSTPNPYKQWVINEIERHPEMDLNLEHYNSYGQRVYRATEKTVSIWVVRANGGFYLGAPRNTIKVIDLVHLQVLPDTKTICVGYNQETKKWCGWSHRGKHCFGVGDSIKYGDVIYKPKSFQMLLGDMFRNAGYIKRVEILSHKSAKLTYRDGTSTTICEDDYEYGRGEYTITTEEEAENAAIAYADSIS